MSDVRSQVIGRRTRERERHQVPPAITNFGHKITKSAELPSHANEQTNNIKKSLRIRGRLCADPFVRILFRTPNACRATEEIAEFRADLNLPAPAA